GAGCQYHSVPLPKVEQAIFDKIENIVADVPAGSGAEELDRRVFELKNSVAGYVDHMAELHTALEAAPTAAGLRRLARLEAEVRTLEAALEEAEEARRLHDEGLIHDRAMRLLGLVKEAREAGDSFTDRG